LKVEIKEGIYGRADVRFDELNYLVDFGVLVLTMSPVEAANLCVEILSFKEIKEEAFKNLNQRR